MAQKNTRRLLMASAVSVIICLAMLVGTTFAWFTDEAVSGNNTIAVGNLDVTLSYRNAQMQEFAEVTDETVDLISDTNGEAIEWEPGAASVTYLKIANSGSLSLKYRLGISAKDSVMGADGAALSKVLKSAVVEIGENEVGGYTRETAVAAARAAGAVGIADYVKEGVMSPQTTEYLAMVVYFPEEVGNIYDGACYNRSDVKLSTEFGVNLFATQTAAEHDGFGNDYDDEAFEEVEQEIRQQELIEQGYTAISSFSEIENAENKEREKFVLTTDVILDGLNASIKRSVTIDFNGHEIRRKTSEYGGNVTISNAQAEVVLENGKFARENGVCVMAAYGAKTLTFRNIDFYNEGEPAGGPRLLQICPTVQQEAMTVGFENCNFYKSAVSFDTGNTGVTAEYNVDFKNCAFEWENDSQNFVLAGSNAKGDFSFEDCRFEFSFLYGDSGGLISIANANPNENPQYSIALKNITAISSGAFAPIVWARYDIDNITVTSEGENRYLQGNTERDWNDVVLRKNA